jgi:phosphate transport system ATP-binding protein
VRAELAADSEDIISIQDFSVNFGARTALRNISFGIKRNSICALIGPSGCGKTTLLRSINRMNDMFKEFSAKGRIVVDGISVYDNNSKRFVSELRRGIGMVFQKPNPLPATIMDNMLLPLKEYRYDKTSDLKEIVREKLRLASLYDEVKDHLNRSAAALSGGQQQRLCIARALLLDPKILLFDEPCSALDPISTYKIEDLLIDLKKDYTIVIVTHNMEQAKRIAGQTAFLYGGSLIEIGDTGDIFSHPKTDMLYKFVSGRSLADSSRPEADVYSYGAGKS